MSGTKTEKVFDGSAFFDLFSCASYLVSVRFVSFCSYQGDGFFLEEVSSSGAKRRDDKKKNKNKNNSKARRSEVSDDANGVLSEGGMAGGADDVGDPLVA